MKGGAMTYRITIRSTGEVLAARAATIEHAAGVIARRLYGRTAWAVRATGTCGKSGIFAAYHHDRRLHATNQVGSEFHVAGAS